MQQHEDVNKVLAQSLSAIAGGDKTAFKTVYTLTAPKLNAIIRGMIKDEALTHDILQQAYVSIWENAGKFDAQKGKAFTWILVITRRKSLDMIRSRTVYGMSSREIGERFGVPTHTAKSWVRRGLQKLKSEIDVEDLHEIL